MSTAKKIYHAILEEREEVYIWWFIPYLRLILDVLPLRLRNFLIARLIGDGMRTFVGRDTTKDE